MTDAAAGIGSFRWENLKSMPTKRVYSSPVIYNDNIYVIGGCDIKGTPLDAFEMYDADKRIWKSLPAMPTKRAGASAVVVGSKIVVLGGVSNSQNPLDVVEVFDIPEKKWSTLDSLREPLLGLSATQRDGKVIVLGGMAVDSNPRDHVLQLDIEKNTWKSLEPLPTPRYASFAFTIKDKLYVIGGRQGKLPVKAFEVYDFSTNKWQKLADIPSKRVFAMYTASDTHVFSVGGLNENPRDGFSATCEAYDIANGKSVHQENPLYGFSATCEAYDIETVNLCIKRTPRTVSRLHVKPCVIANDNWFEGTPIPTPRGDFAIGMLGGRVVCAGGLGNQGRPLTKVECYELSSNSWTEIKDIPSAHASCAYIMLKERLNIIGGLSLQGPSGNMEALGYK